MIAVYDSKVIAVCDSKVIAVCDSKVIAVCDSQVIAVCDSKVIAVYDSKVIAVYDSKVLWCRLLVHLARCSRLQTRMLRASPLTHMVQPSQRPSALREETRCSFMHHIHLSVRHILF